MSTQLNIGDDVDGYVIDEVIAAGSTTTTYRATHDRLGRTVALKVFHAEVFAADPAAREAARRDAVQAARLEHPAIATVYTAGPVGDGMYVASGLVKGESLVDAVGAGEITASRCAEIVTIIASALETAHAAGVNHRELRPQAITVDRWGHPVLRDFGVTRLSGRTGMATRMEFGETLRYSAPELILGRKATPAADIYGLAATAWFCLVGEHPFPDLPVGELVALRASAPAPAVADAPAVNQALATGMALNPEDRPATPTAFAEQLAAAVANLPRSVRDAPSPLRRAEEGVGRTPEPAVTPPAPAHSADMTRVDRQRALPETPAPEDSGRPWATVLTWAGALAACAVTGFALGQVTAPGPPAPLRTGAIALVTGTVWSKGGPGVNVVEVGNPVALQREDAAATVGTLERPELPGNPIPESAFSGDGAAPKPAPVTSGGRTLVRYDTGDATVFALPTTTGTLVATCRPKAADAKCAALLSAARLGKAKPVPPVPAKQESEQVAEALRALEAARGIGEGELSGPADGRANAANALGSAYRTAAQALQEAKSPAATVLKTPLENAATAFEELASAIDRKSAPAFRTARAEALKADARVRRAIASLNNAGYATAR